MTADDLSAPLGQQLRKRRLSIPITTSQVIAGALTLFLGVFVVWALSGTIRSAASRSSSCRPTCIPARRQRRPTGARPGRKSSPRIPTLRQLRPRRDKRQRRRPPPRPSPSSTATPASAGSGRSRLGQRHTPDASRSTRNSSKCRATAPFRRSPPTARGRPMPSPSPAKALPGKPNAPRIAIVVGGLGISASATADAIAKLPGAVTLASCPTAPTSRRWRRAPAPGATRFCCRCRWSRSIIRTTIPARKRC